MRDGVRCRNTGGAQICRIAVESICHRTARSAATATGAYSRAPGANSVPCTRDASKAPQAPPQEADAPACAAYDDHMADLMWNWGYGRPEDPPISGSVTPLGSAMGSRASSRGGSRNGSRHGEVQYQVLQQKLMFAQQQQWLKKYQSDEQVD